MRYFLIHGSFGNPNENWFPWLREKLEEKGNEVIIPNFPTPQNQSLDSWMEIFEKYKDKVDENTIFIGHSLGPAFILSILESINVKVKGCIFVAAFTGLLNNEEFDKINKTFTEREFNWAKIRENSNQFYIINSKDDPYVPFQKAFELERNLKYAGIITLNEAGHINESSGFREFKEILTYIDLVERQDRIKINGPSGKLNGYVTTPENFNGNSIILTHGFGVTSFEGGLFDLNVHKFIENGYRTYRFDFAGRGGSEGDYNDVTLTKLREDLNSIVQYIKSKESGKIGILGQSMGTATTISLKPDVDAIVLTGSVLHIRDTLSKIFKDFNPEGNSTRMRSNGEVLVLKPLFWKDLETHNLIKNLRDIKCPILFIHGLKDEIVPFENSKEYFEAANEPKEIVLLEDTYHSLNPKREEQANLAVQWFNIYLS